MRQYIRHPSDIPISIELNESAQTDSPAQKIDPEGQGLSFNSNLPWLKGSLLHIEISVTSPSFEADGVVAWCKENEDGYSVGVNFRDENSCRRLRMVEQVCHIMHYKKAVMEEEGRELSNDEAAREWIENFAEEFTH